MLQILLIVQMVYLDGTVKRNGIEFETMESCIAAQAKFLNDMEEAFESLGAKSIAAGCSIRRKPAPT